MECDGLLNRGGYMLRQGVVSSDDDGKDKIVINTIHLFGGGDYFFTMIKY